VGAAVSISTSAPTPAGYETTFINSLGDDGCFVYFRQYAPLQPFFDKTFRLNDFEMIHPSTHSQR
jgi:hypothetical protein